MAEMQPPYDTTELPGMAEEQRISGLQFRIADFLRIDPFHPEMIGAMHEANNGRPASIGYIGGEFRIDNVDGSRTPLDNHLARKPHAACMSDVHTAMRTIANFAGRTEQIEDFIDPEAEKLRNELLANRSVFAVEHTDKSGETQRTLWIPIDDNANENNPPTNSPLPLYRRITGSATLPQNDTTSVVVDYVVLPHLRFPETMSQR